MLRAISVFCFLIGLAHSRISYTGEQVVKCSLGNSSSVQQLADVLDVWGVLPDQTIDVRVKNSNERKFLESILKECKTVIEDLELEVQKDEFARANAGDAWFDEYHTYADLDAWYQNFAAANPTFLTYQTIGQTYQGNPIKVLVIATGGSANKANVYMQAQIHAREWISGATANYIINQLVTDFLAGSPDVVGLLNRVNIHFVPILNIDGYLFTWSTDRMWRKNRIPSSAQCFGTDINRNYNDHWGEGGSSTNPCSDTYMGPSVSSELETQATQNYFRGIKNVTVGFDWHSYSQLMLRPYGWTTADSPDETVLKAQGDAYVASIAATSGMVYTSQKSIQLYVTTGTASDWFYGNDATTNNGGFWRAAGYTVELRPINNPPGFLLPPAQIVPTGNENYRALIPLLNYFAVNPIRPS